MHEFIRKVNKKYNDVSVSKGNDNDNQINYNKVFEVQIIDTGVGIDQEQQQYLFVPF